MPTAPCQPRLCSLCLPGPVPTCCLPAGCPSPPLPSHLPPRWVACPSALSPPRGSVCSPAPSSGPAPVVSAVGLVGWPPGGDRLVYVLEWRPVSLPSALSRQPFPSLSALFPPFLPRPLPAPPVSLKWPSLPLAATLPALLAGQAAAPRCALRAMAPGADGRAGDARGCLPPLLPSTSAHQSLPSAAGNPRSTACPSSACAALL